MQPLLEALLETLLTKHGVKLNEREYRSHIPALLGTPVIEPTPTGDELYDDVIEIGSSRLLPEEEFFLGYELVYQRTTTYQTRTGKNLVIACSLLENNSTKQQCVSKLNEPTYDLSSPTWNVLVFISSVDTSSQDQRPLIIAQDGSTYTQYKRTGKPEQKTGTEVTNMLQEMLA